MTDFQPDHSVGRGVPTCRTVGSCVPRDRRKKERDNLKRNRKETKMNMKTVMIALAAVAMSGAANAITSEEIANVLGVDPNIATFSMAGDTEWTIDTNVFHSGSTSMKSGKFTWNNSDFHGSDLIMTINIKEAYRLRYWFKMAVTDTSSSNEKLFSS